jgi:hypothetical protein
MDLDSYVKQVLEEHLLTKDYEQLSEATTKQQMAEIKSILQNILKDNQNNLSKSELSYFHRSLKTHFRLPIFYGLPKVHKIPMSLRPVVSSTNSLLAVFSVWLDYKAKELLPLIQSYLKDSATLIHSLKTIYIPKNALVFTADATSMYTNIKADIGLETIKNFLHINEAKLPTLPSASLLTKRLSFQACVLPITYT